MGIYETLYAFLGAFGSPMGDPGTHPWSQGYPRTEQLPGGPAIPDSIPVSPEHLRYPKAWGLPALRTAIASYYCRHYGCRLGEENVMVFAGGRPGLVAVLLFLASDVTVRVASTEYTPYYDMLRRLGRRHELVESSIDNGFSPGVEDFTTFGAGRRLVLLSNPCNPTGITRTADDLARLVDSARGDGPGLLVDEAYELFHEAPVSALEFVDDIEDSNIFVAGAATKGLQAPGIRIGWIVSSREHIEVLGNFSSFGMGGVSHPSQCFALELFEEERIPLAREAVPRFYGWQRARYGEALERLGLELHSGRGGFYHWCRLPGDLTGEQLNRRLFEEGAAVLKGIDCDMRRLGSESPLRQFIRFSFGPLAPESFNSDVEILDRALNG